MHETVLFFHKVLLRQHTNTRAPNATRRDSFMRTNARSRAALLYSKLHKISAGINSRARNLDFPKAKHNTRYEPNIGS
jgi:hypothetical protein